MSDGAQQKFATRLDPAQLYHACDFGTLGFHTTAELPDLHETLGQARALGALEFGIGMRHEGYNLYVMGSPGLGKHAIVRAILEDHTRQAATPPDLCYVHNARAPHRPRMLRLPTGMATALQRDMRALVRTLLAALPAAFEGEDYRNRAQELKDEIKTQQERAINAVTDEATQASIALVRTPMGFTIAPVRDGKVVDADAFDQLPEDERKAIEAKSEAIRESLRQTMTQVAALERELERRTRQLDDDVAQSVVDRHVADVEARYRGQADALAFLADVRHEAAEHAADFRRYAAENKEPPDGAQLLTPFNRYYVNVLVDSGAGKGAPIVHEDNPTYQNLLGRIEHMAQFGTLLTDFTLIQSGALHRANGGYLVLDAHKVLGHVFAWDALKRALRARGPHPVAGADAEPRQHDLAGT